MQSVRGIRGSMTLCEMCGLYIENLKEHRQKCRKYTCEVCKQIFSSEENLDIHMKKAGKEELEAATRDGGACVQQ